MALIALEEQNDYWTKYARERLLGKKIVIARYMEPDEVADMGWTVQPLALIFDDGSYVFPSMDDEGNDGGSLSGTYTKELLPGKKVIDVQYMTQEKADSMGYHMKPVVIYLDNGYYVFPCRDDEGNDGGALFGASSDREDSGSIWTFPVI